MLDLTSLDLPRELDHRATDGIEVALLWSGRAGRLWVTVADTRSGESFELDVTAADAIEAFHHPYAYAARGGVAFGEPVRA